MDLRKGSKRIKSIYKGENYIPGIIVNGRLWHGSPGRIAFTSGYDTWDGDKVYYGNIPETSASYVKILSGGIVSSASITDRTLEVYSGGTANDITLDDDGSIRVYSSGTASNVTVNSGGIVYVAGAGSASIKENGGYVSDGGRKSFIKNTITDLHLFTGGRATVHSGTTLNGATVERMARLEVYSGGIANNIILSSDYLTVSSGGSLYVYAGGTATNVTSQTGAKIIVSSGGYITYT